ncbi:MAG: Methionyl-tRNA formyltransferase, partial [Solirubrobacterales bacterium]|nr:Methionyl-tRNA formyltransferase [Solirubrobacterales bacterium]
RPRGRGRRLASPPVAETARALGLTLAQPASVNDPDTVAAIDSVRPDAVVVCAFGAIIKEPLLSSHELLNVHPSLLPRWRGAAPIERAITAGDRTTGVSILRLTAGLDSGPVCAIAEEPIGAEDTYGSLSGRLQQLGARLLLEVLDAKADARAPQFVEQDEDGATYAEKITPDDRMLDPRRPAVELERVVRALHPHVGARAELEDGSLLGVHEAALVPAPDVGARGVVALDGRLLLACADGALELRVVQPPGGRTMTGADYLRGHGIAARL